ncbi:MAG: ribonuclease P protein component [Bacteroidaceae bacterium]
MAEVHLHTLPKSERLCSRKALQRLFSGERRSISVFPIRAVFMESEEPGIRIMVSVSKRHFKHAVKRNRVKRQLREAYRLNKQILQNMGTGLDIAFLWNIAEILPSQAIMQKMQHLLYRIHESITQAK